MTATPSTTRDGRSDRAAALLLGSAALLVVADALVPLLLGAVESWVYYLLFVLALAGTTVAGAVLLRDQRHAGLGRLLLGIAIAGGVYDLCGWGRDTGPFGFLEGLVYGVYAGLITHLAVRWPDDRIRGAAARVLVAAVYVLTPLLALLWQVTWDARWFASPGGWWLTLLPARGFSQAVYTAGQVVFVVLVAALVVLLVARTIAARGPRRAAMLPVVVVGVVLAATVVVQGLQGLGLRVPVDAALLQSIAVLAIPVAVLIAAARRPRAGDDVVMPGRRRTESVPQDR